MPAKADKGGKAAKPAKAGASSGGKSGKKKKWSKGKSREKLNNLVLFDKATYEKLMKEAPTYKLITPSILSERMKINGSLARKAIKDLMAKGLIRLVSSQAGQSIYTRAITTADK
eukprot:TRINITY_DN507_c0_g1_i1.p1 TRINITY_DN507_c0_g1~~TRINITY_DN507_c0_g1_i1.p1  ORF type:complete len:115 (-),score=40.82 TRINITY_DN507_c0_g1_i1:59-403(-)